VPTSDGASEGFGQVLLEAQSCGVPVVGSDMGGIPEAMQPGTTGLLSPPGDEKALAECLMLVLGWPEQRLAEVSRQCRSWAKSRFDLCSMTSRLEEIYDATQENQEARGLRP
jgi:glycosyltransferase involved in cell wall biosynthesis